MKVMSNQKKELADSIEQLKKYPGGDSNFLGKCRLPLAVYKKQCLDRITSLEKQMAAHPKSSPMWQKLRKRKLAQ